MLSRKLTIAGFAICALTSAALAHGQTATLKGRFLYDGTPPAAVPVNVDKDQQVCGKHNLTKEELVIGKNREIANVVVWLTTKDVAPPGGAQQPAGPAVVENKDCRFTPHVVLMRAGQPLEIKNGDTIAHNTMGVPMQSPQFNPNIPPSGVEKILTITKPETRPFPISCAIHTWMKGYVLVTDGPYAAVSGADGKFEIKDLPAGQSLEFKVWHDKGWLKNTTMGAGKVSPLGKVKLTLKPGENDLGDIKVDSATLK